MVKDNIANIKGTKKADRELHEAIDVSNDNILQEIEDELEGMLLNDATGEITDEVKRYVDKLTEKIRQPIKDIFIKAKHKAKFGELDEVYAVENTFAITSEEEGVEVTATITTYVGAAND